MSWLLNGNSIGMERDYCGKYKTRKSDSAIYIVT